MNTANNENRVSVSEEQFRQDLERALGTANTRPLPPAPEPVKLQLPDIERWLRDG